MGGSGAVFSLEGTHYKDQQTIEYSPEFMSGPHPLSFADLPTFLHIVVSFSSHSQIKRGRSAQIIQCQ